MKQYADDTAMFRAADSVSELEEVFENDLDSEKKPLLLMERSRTHGLESV